MEKICIGKIINTHGLKGEVKIQSYSDFDELRYQKGNKLYIKTEESYMPVEAASYRVHKGFPLVSFKGMEDINLIEKYKGCTVYIDRKDRRPLEDNAYYQDELLDKNVYDEQGNYLGTVTAIEPAGWAQNNLRVAGENQKSFLIPCIPEFIKKVDPDQNQIIVHMEKGLL